MYQMHDVELATPQYVFCTSQNCWIPGGCVQVDGRHVMSYRSDRDSIERVRSDPKLSSSFEEPLLFRAIGRDSYVVPGALKRVRYVQQELLCAGRRCRIELMDDVEDSH